MSNPYRHLLQQMRLLLKSEERMSVDESRAFSWILRVDVGASNCSVIKGGANTIIIAFGDERLEPRYPQEALQVMGTLARQEHAMYRVVRASGARRDFFARGAALRVPPQEGSTIVGLNVDHTTQAVTHHARLNAAGRLGWVARR